MSIKSAYLRHWKLAEELLIGREQDISDSEEEALIDKIEANWEDMTDNERHYLERLGTDWWRANYWRLP